MYSPDTTILEQNAIQDLKNNSWRWRTVVMNTIDYVKEAKK